MVGFSSSSTVTWNEHSAVLPALSVTRYRSIVTPTGKTWFGPNPAYRVVVWPAQLSAPVGAVYVTVALQRPGVRLTTMSLGQVMVGSSVSDTTMLKLQLDVNEY
jgi:hypothetical protein